MRAHPSPPHRTDRFAALFIDYENLHQFLLNRLGPARPPIPIVPDLVEALRRHLLREDLTKVVLSVAFADFGRLDADGGGLQRALSLREIEPRFVAAAPQFNAAELQLCIEAVDLLHERTDIETVVVLTGDRAYLPLLQRLRRQGRHVVLAALDVPAAFEQGGLRDLLLDASGFLNEATRRALQEASMPAAAPGQAAPPAEPLPVAIDAAEPAYDDVHDPVLLRTLEIIEEYFGQYDEVYLTPLLRKLSEVLDEHENDPKSLVSDLEKAGAVHLEKRRGFPYDYTVLIVNPEHPDVQRIQEAFFDPNDPRDHHDEPGTDDYYEPDEYAESEYDFSEDDYEADVLRLNKEIVRDADEGTEPGR